MDSIQAVEIEVDGHEAMDVVADLEDRLEFVGIVSYRRETLQDSFWQLRRCRGRDWSSTCASICSRVECAITIRIRPRRRSEIGCRIRRIDIEREWAFQLFCWFLQRISNMYERSL